GHDLVAADDADSAVVDPEVVDAGQPGTGELAGCDRAAEVAVEPEAVGDWSDRHDLTEVAVEAVQQLAAERARDARLECGGHGWFLSLGVREIDVRSDAGEQGLDLGLRR